MKIDSTPRDIQRSASFQERSMGLAKGSEAFVFNVLRKDLYSDPIGSLIREYTVNAQDEHRKHNKTNVPIHIQVPNQFSPELHIRDFAGGLTEEQVFNFFGNYGASDKRDSNVAVGFFGLGCKSAFAYTDSYIVKSYKDGKVYTFNAYIDETEVGKVAKISEEDTTESNGIQIIVPVKSHNIWEFQRKVVSTVSYFKTKPVITGLAEAPVFDSKKSVIKGDGWEFFGSGSPTVVMGEIPYPLDYHKMENLEDWEYNLLRSEIVLYVNIGDVQVTASREALQMSAKTIKTIREKLKSIKDAMVAQTEKAFSEATNLIEAKQLYYSVVKTGGGYSRIIESSGDIKWKGKVIDDNIIRLGSINVPSPHYVTTYAMRYSGRIESSTSQRIFCDPTSPIYFDDTNKAKVGYKRRARTLLTGTRQNIQVVHTTDIAGLEKILGVPVTSLNSYNAVVPTIAQSNRVGGGTGVDLSKRAKHTSKVFVLNVDKLKGYFGAASEVWDLQEVEDLKGVYISIERFKPFDLPKIYDLATLRNLLVSLEKAGIDIDVPIYGIKKGGSTNGLVRLDKWVDKKVSENKSLVEKYKLIQSYVNNNLENVADLKVDALSDESVAKKYATLYKKVKDLYIESRSSGITNIFTYSSVKVEADDTIQKLCKEFKAKYPVLNVVNCYSYGTPEVTSYIMEKDKG